MKVDFVFNSKNQHKNIEKSGKPTLVSLDKMQNKVNYFYIQLSFG